MVWLDKLGLVVRRKKKTTYLPNNLGTKLRNLVFQYFVLINRNRNVLIAMPISGAHECEPVCQV